MTPLLNLGCAPGCIVVLSIARISGMDLIAWQARPLRRHSHWETRSRPCAPSGKTKGPPAAGPRLLCLHQACCPASGPHRGDPVTRMPASRRCSASSHHVTSGAFVRSLHGRLEQHVLADDVNGAVRRCPRHRDGRSGGRVCAVRTSEPADRLSRKSASSRPLCRGRNRQCPQEAFMLSARAVVWQSLKVHREQSRHQRRSPVACVVGPVLVRPIRGRQSG